MTGKDISAKNELNASKLLREARKRSGLMQRELAKRSGKAQSAIARIESGRSDPSTEMLQHLVEAAGFEIQTELSVKAVEKSHMKNDVSRILSLSPERRLQEVADMDHFLKVAKREKNTKNTD